MDKDSIYQLLTEVSEKKVSIEQALEQLKRLPFEETAVARLDHHRCLRTGYPEVVFGIGKTAEQVLTIFAKLDQHGHPVLLTKAIPEHLVALEKTYASIECNLAARTAVLWPAIRKEPVGEVMILTGGTADIPIAEEASITLEVLGVKPLRYFDVGVAGLHRVLSILPELQKAKCIIAVAGMEGALPSVVAGLVSCPVIGVPTSIGYGSFENGRAALLSMLNSCANSVAVVNIDNGYGAAVVSAQIVKQGHAVH